MDGEDDVSRADAKLFQALAERPVQVGEEVLYFRDFAVAHLPATRAKAGGSLFFGASRDGQLRPSVAWRRRSGLDA